MTSPKQNSGPLFVLHRSLPNIVETGLALGGALLTDQLPSPTGNGTEAVHFGSNTLAFLLGYSGPVLFIPFLGLVVFRLVRRHDDSLDVLRRQSPLLSVSSLILLVVATGFALGHWQERTLDHVLVPYAIPAVFAFCALGFLCGLHALVLARSEEAESPAIPGEGLGQDCRDDEEEHGPIVLSHMWNLSFFVTVILGTSTAFVLGTQAGVSFLGGYATGLFVLAVFAGIGGSRAMTDLATDLRGFGPSLNVGRFLLLAVALAFALDLANPPRSMWLPVHTLLPDQPPMSTLILCLVAGAISLGSDLAQSGTTKRRIRT
ncbi:MAG: hypothetical protein K9H25_17200 [Rhodospirillum sp.]|nr:hypothetical protein [Rhodospirillum sp.]MCF8501789.1 hypothetical protein [Rhodospirillum sp.]